MRILIMLVNRNRHLHRLPRRRERVRATRVRVIRPPVVIWTLDGLEHIRSIRSPACPVLVIVIDIRWLEFVLFGLFQVYVFVDEGLGTC